MESLKREKEDTKTMTLLTHTAFAGLTAWVFGLNTGIAITGSTAPDWFEDLFGIHEHRGLTHYLTIWFIALIFFLVLTLEKVPYADLGLSFSYVSS